MTNQIAMYFGHSIPENPRHKEIEDRAIEWGCTINFAILEDFDWTFTHIHKVHQDSEIFNMLFQIVTLKSVQAPQVEVKYGKDNSSEVPTFLFANSHIIEKSTNKKIPITHEILDQIGSEIENIYGYVYIGSKILNHGENWVFTKSTALP